MKNIIIFPSSNLRSVIHHYEWQELGEYANHHELPIYPNILTGLLFLFYTEGLVTVKNAVIHHGVIPRTALIPPTSIPTYNYSPNNLKVLRCIFQPGIISSLFKFPLKVATNSLVDLGEAFDYELKFLHENMSERPELCRCIELFENYLLNKLNFTPSKGILHALKRLDSNKLHGVKVQQLAADLGISRRHFNRLVQEQIGFTAKHFLQIYRF